ncbi:hypothetical protein ACNOYE_06615 [Nannocystaceae bacterium ST9]
MMATRILRTERIANLSDFGAIPNNPLATVQNAQAFRAAFDSGARRISIPAGDWYFEQIMYQGNPWLPVGTEIFGQGQEGQTNLVYKPTDLSVPAFLFAPNTVPFGLLARSTLHHFRLEGPVGNDFNTPPQGIGISFDQSLFNRVRDVVIGNFGIGIQLSAGTTPYSGYNYVERFDVFSCQTGIYVGDHTNACVLQNGRVFYSLVLYTEKDPKGAREEGVGIHIVGTPSNVGVPQGAQGLVISGVNVEASPLCLSITGSMGVTVQGCYFEPGNFEEGSTRRRSVYVDESTMNLTFEGALFSEPGVPFGEWNWTPTYLELPPETRGVVDVPQAPQSGNAYAVNAYGGAICGATAAHVNRLKNSDMSRGALFWSNSVPPPFVAVHQTPFVTGGASTMLTVNASTGEHVYQDFVVDSGVRSVTVGVRYQILDSDSDIFAFRIDLIDVASGTRLGFFSDTGVGPTSWRVRSLTGRFDGLAGGVVGPRRLRVRVYPYAGDVAELDGQRVLVDSVWVVEGEYAASYRSYAEGVELLLGDEREIFLSGTANAPMAPIAIGPSRVPSNAIGAVLELMISGTGATANQTILRVNDLSGSSPSRDLHAFVSNRPSMTEYTIPFTAGTPPVWQVIGASGANAVTYSARLKAWVLRT